MNEHDSMYGTLTFKDSDAAYRVNDKPSRTIFLKKELDENN